MSHHVAPFGLRMPDDLKDWVKESAREEGRSANNLIVHILNRARAAAVGQGVEASPSAAECEAAAR